MTKTSGSKTLGPKQRLRKKTDIARCSKKGRRVHSKHFLLQVIESGLPVSRLALAVSKKIDKRAVHRNKLKRRLREFFRNHRNLLKIESDVVITAKADSIQLGYREIVAEILEALRKAKLLEKETDDKIL